MNNPLKVTLDLEIKMQTLLALHYEASLDKDTNQVGDDIFSVELYVSRKNGRYLFAGRTISTYGIENVAPIMGQGYTVEEVIDWLLSEHGSILDLDDPDFSPTYWVMQSNLEGEL